MRTPPRLSRRTAVGGAAALTALVVSGCTEDGGARGTPATTATTTATSGTPTRPAAAPDVALAVAVLRGEQSMLDRLVATARRHPGLAATVSGARSTHRAHLRLLLRAVPDGSPSRGPDRTVRPGRVPRRPGPALAALARAETRLSTAGQANAVRARSGAFARVLASMAAASAQQAERLAELAADRR